MSFIRLNTGGFGKQYRTSDSFPSTATESCKQAWNTRHAVVSQAGVGVSVASHQVVGHHLSCRWSRGRCVVGVSRRGWQKIENGKFLCEVQSLLIRCELQSREIRAGRGGGSRQLLQPHIKPFHCSTPAGTRTQCLLLGVLALTRLFRGKLL